MKTPAAGKHAEATGQPSEQTPVRNPPVLIYPFNPPVDYWILRRSTNGCATQRGPAYLCASDHGYGPQDDHLLPGNKAFCEFHKGTVSACSDVLDAWCVDTCQMWYSGLGGAFETGEPGDIYWLIPGDFNYGSAAGREVWTASITFRRLFWR